MKNNEIFKGFKCKNLSLPGAEFLPLNLKGFKGVFMGEVKFKGFSRVSRVSATMTGFIKNLEHIVSVTINARVNENSHKKKLMTTPHFNDVNN